MVALNEAKQALADCPAYHRVLLHFRVVPSANIATTSSSLNPTNADVNQEEECLPNNQQTMIDLEIALAEAEITPDELAEPTQPKKGPGRLKGSRTRLKDPKPLVIPLAYQRATRLQVASQKAIQDQTNSKRRRTAEPRETIDEQPDNND